MGNRSSSSGGGPATVTSAGSETEIKLVSDITSERVRRGFRQHCNRDGKLDKPTFNAALSILEDLGLRRLRETPLGERLFSLFDRDASSAVDEEEFVKGVSILTSDSQPQKIDLTFQAYDTRKDGRISKADLVDILQASWLAAFRFLAEKLRSSSHGSSDGKPSSRQIQDFAKKNLSKFREATERSFDRYDPLRTGYLDRAAFEQWASQDRTISAKYGSHAMQVAVTFLNIEKPPLYPSL
ncbi:unnamed protein product [Vitrella brassicaformis CCMP3155]|uniref:EF-hand domain-containing protein n=1 Tax=Vitrella brassicaformis (strain CCMP3155) TaxID=1169540 RepID=A0A0G4FIG3_VITBC|nr:unnamed protein product [Vitrella brassicaformis CCMP3155]|mmetsp:Transcript_4215/g.9630  ORF Transcript_4215/g.9630 Transcript_4215/m.9630 type:complete len:240 (-) Transcript_4215:129-848(-)|eukprot:CEM13236.1 unnamed protein product [Vitrella brassicaformis CCMP3155]